MPKSPRIPHHWQHYFRSQAEQAPEPLGTFYRAGTVNASTPLNSLTFMAMDFETTGLDADQHEIISIGLIPFTLKRIFCRRASHLLVQPEGELLSDSVTIHGITHDDLMQAERLQNVLPRLLAMLAGHVVVVHYRQIERDFLWQASQRLFGHEWLFPLIDTMQLESRLLKQQRRFWQWSSPKASLRLVDCRQRYHLPHYTLHHALNDALATAELLQAQLQHHCSADEPVGQFLV